MDSNEAAALPFSGLLVVSVEQAVAAPLCTCRLAESGARVIKIERPEGDFARNYDGAVKGHSAYFVWANHGKESLQLNIKEAQDAELLHRLLPKADVFVQNLAPGAMARAGFGSEALRAKYPRLITCDISGYGEGGQYQNMKAYDFLVQCESGLVSISGPKEAYGRIGVSLCDIGAGTNALTGIQQALFLRERTGKGIGVAVSLFDTAADWMTVPLLHEQYGEGAPERVGMHHPSIAPYGAYGTLDEQVLVVAIQNEREWQTFCAEVLDMPEVAQDSRFISNNARVKNRVELDRIIEGVFGRFCRKNMSVLLQGAGIAFGALNSVRDLIEHPQLRRRTVTTPDGQKAELLASPVRSTFADNSKGIVPALGQHNELIRQEFKVGSDEEGGVR